MNVEHRLTITGTCPVDGTTDVYDLTVTTNAVLLVEDILAAVQEVTAKPRSQEEITWQLSTVFPDGTSVCTVGTHSGVQTTVRC